MQSFESPPFQGFDLLGLVPHDLWVHPRRVRLVRVRECHLQSSAALARARTSYFAMADAVGESYTSYTAYYRLYYIRLQEATFFVINQKSFKNHKSSVSYIIYFLFVWRGACSSWIHGRDDCSGVSWTQKNKKMIAQLKLEGIYPMLPPKLLRLNNEPKTV